MVATDDRHSATVQLTFSEFVEFQFTFLSNIDNYLSHAIVKASVHWKLAIVNVGPLSIIVIILSKNHGRHALKVAPTLLNNAC